MLSLVAMVPLVIFGISNRYWAIGLVIVMVIVGAVLYMRRRGDGGGGGGSE